MNGDVQFNLVTLEFKNRERLEYFHSIILIIWQEINLSGETVSVTRLIFPSIKALSKSNKLKAIIVPKMIDIIKFLDNNIKFDFYTGGGIHGLCSYLEINGAPTTLTTSSQRSRHFGPLYSINNDIETLHTVIAFPRVLQKTICKWCGRIGHKSYSCIICGPKFLPPSLIRNMNQLNNLFGKEPT